MKIIGDIQIDDSYLHRRTEEHIKEINEKNRKIAQEIYDTVMAYRRHNSELNSEEDTD